MIIDFNKAAARRRQQDNKFRDCIIDAMTPFDDDLDALFDRLSSQGIRRISDFIDSYGEEEFFETFGASREERKRFLEALTAMRLQFTG